MENMNLKLSPPWNTYQQEVKALFESDPDIEVGDVNNAPDGSDFQYYFDMTVNNHDKFVAMLAVLPEIVNFGNVDLKINMIDRSSDENPYISLYETIFQGNAHLKDIKKVQDFAGTTHAYIRFKPEVIQFYQDDISDYSGNWSGLAQDIARDLFTHTGVTVHFCTADLREDNNSEVNNPLV